ncbi:MAG: FtsQ-type POTRA domain-containing protein [Treponema sp.]|jgi:cell division protein FtsQ|nr:FtsQ-type POTRA domain-containing protein [Treponema sp.]
MSGDFIYSEDALSPKPAVRGFEKGLKRLIIIAAVILGAECIWLFVVSPCMPLSTVEVNTFPGFDRAEVLALAGIGEGASFLSVDAGAAEKALEEYYLVDSARVIKRFPDRVRIYLEPRQAAALSLAAVSGRALPVYFDREGVIFKIGNEDGRAPGNLPIISGLVFEQPALGMRLPAALTPLLAELEKIKAAAPELLGAVSEIRINRKPFDGFDLILYPLHNPVKVRLEHTINEDTLRYVMLLLDVFESEDAMPEEIDFRSGVASYTVKEAPPGE